MVRQTKSGKVDKRANSSAANAKKAREKLSSYVARGKRMREEESEDEFDIRDSDFDSETEVEAPKEPEVIEIPVVEIETVPDPIKVEPVEVVEPVVEPIVEPVVELLVEDNDTFKSVRKIHPDPIVEPIVEPVVEKTQPIPIPVPVQTPLINDLQKAKYKTMSDRLRCSILRF